MREELEEKYELREGKLFFKYDNAKGADWNNRYKGREVKPLLSNGKGYIFLNNSLYSQDQAILCMTSDFEVKLHPYSIPQLVKMQNSVRESLKNKTTQELLDLTDRINKGSNIKEEVDSLKKYVKKGLNERFNKWNVKVNDKGLPKHIYKDTRGSIFVEVQYQTNVYKKKGFKTIEEALGIRNKIYDDIHKGIAKGCSLYNESLKRNK
ncbi:hypothetical protein P9477_23265 [Enterobacter mori]|uniref:hypothetical protein n=1 Tax=Enterobacter mori TaxID=539813 RepID=UPI00398B5608